MRSPLTVYFTGLRASSILVICMPVTVLVQSPMVIKSMNARSCVLMS